MPDGVTVTTQAACPTCATLFGNTGMGILMGPGQFNFDMSILKTTRITESEHSPVPGGVLQLAQPSAVQLNGPEFRNRRFGASQLPQPSTTARGSSPLTSVNPRVIQLGLKFIF